MSNFNNNNNQGFSGEGRHHDGGAFGSTNTRDSGYNSGVSGGSGYDNPSSTNAGPHSSNLLNKADPRVDSDRDGRSGTGNSTGAGLGGNTPGTSYGSGTHSGYGGNTSTHDNPRSTNQGPHNSNTLNKADPRVDSDRDGRSGPERPTGTGTGYGNTTGSGHGNNTTGSGYGNTGSGYGGSNSGSNTGSNTNNPNYDNPQSTNQGPHGSNIANKLDPRVDSNRNDGSGTGGGYGSGTGGGLGSRNPNEEQNQISSNAEGHGNGGSSTTGTGPHKSRLGNILDPRVDSNTGGSGTGGGPATANASVTGSGPTGAPEGQASASGPTSANANTTTNPVRGAINKVTGERYDNPQSGGGNNINRGTGVSGPSGPIGPNVGPADDVHHQVTAPGRQW